MGADLVSIKSLQVGVESDDLRKHWRFGTDEPKQLFALYGWQASVQQPGEEGASFGRYTEQPPPLKILGMRRSFFVTAKKGKSSVSS